MRGKQGTGKGVFARGFGHLLNQHFLHLARSKHLVGNFNAHLRDAVVVFADEAFLAADDKETEGVLKAIRKAVLRANVKPGVHILRHTFCSHLAMRGAPARSIQELAGHENLATTQRYMHLSPAAIEGAIRLLEYPVGLSARGDSGEADATEIANSSR
jgi:site-specific recombinase XerD